MPGDTPRNTPGDAPRDSAFLDSYLPYVLRRADQTLSAPFYAVLTQHGIARSEWRLLAVLEDLGELSVLDLAAESLSPQPTVTHALRRLEKRGLIVRTTGERDKRQRFISITPAGSELTVTLIAEARRLEADALADLGSDRAGEDVLGDLGDLGELIDRLRGLTARLEARGGTVAEETEAG